MITFYNREDDILEVHGSMLKDYRWIVMHSLGGSCLENTFVIGRSAFVETLLNINIKG